MLSDISQMDKAQFRRLLGTREGERTKHLLNMMSADILRFEDVAAHIVHYPEPDMEFLLPVLLRHVSWPDSPRQGVSYFSVVSLLEQAPWAETLIYLALGDAFVLMTEKVPNPPAAVRELLSNKLLAFHVSNFSVMAALNEWHILTNTLKHCSYAFKDLREASGYRPSGPEFMKDLYGKFLYDTNPELENIDTLVELLYTTTMDPAMGEVNFQEFVAALI